MQIGAWKLCEQSQIPIGMRLVKKSFMHMYVMPKFGHLGSYIAQHKGVFLREFVLYSVDIYQYLSTSYGAHHGPLPLHYGIPSKNYFSERIAFCFTIPLPHEFIL